MASLRYITHSLTGSRQFFVPAGGTVLWGEATAPTGWEFVTDLDGYFVMGYTSVDLTARGALTHKHSNPSTTSDGAHTDHSVSAPKVSGWASSSFEGASGHDQYAGGSHTHNANSIGTPSSAGDHVHTIADTDEASNLPKYKRLRWIKALGKAEAPVGSIVMHRVSGTALGDNWKVCDGNNGTPDMRGYFVYSGSGTDGGSDSHAHTSPNTNSAGAHTHDVWIKTGGVSTLGSNGQGATSPGHRYTKNHTHETTVTSSSAESHAHSVGSTSTDTVLPPYVQLYFVRRIA